MSATLSAASKLRDQVLSMDGTILLVSPGHPDKVIRVLPLPEFALEYKRARSEGRDLSKHLKLDLGNGPDSEIWREIERQIFLSPERGRVMPVPLSVSKDSNSEWGVSPEEVPTVSMFVAPSAPATASAPVAAPETPLSVEPPPAAVPVLTKKKGGVIMKCKEPNCVVEVVGYFAMKKHLKKAHGE